MRHRLIALAAALFALSGAGARADTVAGWEVSPKPDGDSTCSVQRNYVDPDDDDAKNSVNFLFGKAKDGSAVLGIVVGYERWEYDKDEKATADVLLDDTVDFRAANWIALNPKVLFTTFSNAEGLIQQIARASSITLRFDGNSDTEASFDIPDAAQAFGAAQICRGQLN